ncbi:hypothetical protein BD310DRAFT_1020567 [Dichomitus squalens]|uniref:Mid2 domain-containing protein n=2 Tax=Dichomitus squalens TaxID=114155 RepID=A0A4Q9PSP3_9APHY|nr:hypothetical protein BD310DRAFT_1020567 [Dichomitus squalens]
MCIWVLCSRITSQVDDHLCSWQWYHHIDFGDGHHYYQRQQHHYDDHICISGSVTTTSSAITSAVSGNATITTSAVNGTTTSTSTNGTVISLPSITSTSVATTNLTTSHVLTSTPSVDSQFTFVTGTSLAVASTPSESTLTTTATDPDTPSTTFTLQPSSASPSQAALPSDLPNQIFPAAGSHPGDPDLDGYTQISLLFDAALNWEFVLTNPNSSAQIFAWMSPILQASLDLTAEQVKTYQLHVYVPADYTGPSDVDLLQTMYLGWIPTGAVDTLAQQLKVTSSAFYTALNSPYSDLAKHVVSSFPVENAPGSTDGSSGSNDSGSGHASSGSSSSKTREDAIIGVVTSLGAITLLILAFLVYRAIKQRRELAHRRLSDPHQTEFIGAPPEEDHEFDRDSVGGQRRRSFYYAADSLRGLGDHGAAAASGAAAEDPFNPSMRERRPVIGTPILRDNTMNW